MKGEYTTVAALERTRYLSLHIGKHEDAACPVAAIPLSSENRLDIVDLNQGLRIVALEGYAVNLAEERELGLQALRGDDFHDILASASALNLRRRVM